MIKKIGKACVSLAIAVCLSFAAWHFLLIDLPEHQVQGLGSPNMSKEEALDLMSFHDVKVVYVKDGQWVFERNGKTCQLSKKK